MSAQELKLREKRLLKALSESIARRDRLEADKDRLQRKKTHGIDLARINEDIRDVNRELRKVRANIHKRRKWLKRIHRAIKRAMRPKVIDLKLDFRPMTPQGGVSRVIGHYTAGPRDEDTKDAIRLCRIYHQAHLNNGWSGEGYHICFTSDGDILVLRPAHWVGAHTLGYNTGSYGVMCHGTTGDTPTRAQKRAMRWWAKNGHKSRMGAGRTNVKPGDLPWGVHKDFNPTSCPGSFEAAYRSKGK